MKEGSIICPRFILFARASLTCGAAAIVVAAVVSGFQVAPSILGAAVCEAVAFLVGALTDIPALRQFCLVAATAVAVGFVLQVHGTQLLTAVTRAVSGSFYLE